jgi:hypothetical protein
MDWAGETVRFAEKVGASVVIFHPESIEDRQMLDEIF